MHRKIVIPMHFLIENPVIKFTVSNNMQNYNIDKRRQLNKKVNK